MWKSKIIPMIFSDYNAEKFTKYVEIKQHIPEQPMGQRRNQKRNFLKILKQRLKHSTPKLVWYGKISSNRKVYSNKCLQ